MKDADTAWGEYRERFKLDVNSERGPRWPHEQTFKAGWDAALNALREHQAADRAAAEDRKPL